MRQDIERMNRRLLSMIGTGRSTTPSIGGPTPKVQVSFIGTANAGPEIRDDIPSVQLFGFASETLPGADYVVGFLSGDRSKGVAVASNDRRYRPTINPGEAMVYDSMGRQIYLSAAGGTIINANGAPVAVNGASTVTVNASTTVTINAPTAVVMNTPLLKVSGDIIDNSGTNTATMANMRTIYNEHDHTLSGVQGGESTLTTSTPIQQEN
jgi:phage gp45-like